MGKNHVESSLKRFLKRKVKITMGFVVAFMIMGTGVLGMEYTTPIESSKDEDIIELNIKDWNQGGQNWGIINTTQGSTIDINSKEMYISTENKFSYGIVAQDGGTINVGTTDKIENIKITTVADSFAIGLYTDCTYNSGLGGGTININTNRLEIDVTGKGKNTFGIYSVTRTENEVENKLSKIEINAKDTIINVKGEGAIGIAAWSQGKVKINEGNVKITAPQLISTRGKAVTEINKNNNPDYIVDLKGDIVFEYASNSGTPVDADVTIKLANSQSKFTGRIFSNKVSGTPSEEDLKYKGMELGLSNGGTWENTGDSFVNTLTLNGGVIDNKSVDSDIKVDKLLGNGGAVNMVAAIDEATGKATSGALNIDNIGDKTKLDINYSGTDNLEVNKEKAEEVFSQLAEKITVENGNLNATAKLEEGFVSSEYVSELVKDEKGNIVVKEDSVKVGNLNSMVEGMRDLATINLLTWRQEINSLNKRMGELRNSIGEHGVWSRVYTGKIENGSKYDNDYQTYQVGYDKKYTVDNGVMFVGGLVSYSDGETDYALGHGENYSVGAGIYATWLNNDGQFADVVLKQSRLHNKFDVRSKDLDKSQSGDYNNWGTSLSGQYGKRFDLNDKFFIEPSVELTLGRVDDTTYTTSAGVDVHQDTMYSLIGNVGTSVGYKFSDKGNVYARAALVKEFQGDIDTEYEKDGALERTSEDLGDTWAEFGVGVNYRFVENMNVYVDVQKTGEATVDNKWQANLGFRYEF